MILYDPVFGCRFAPHLRIDLAHESGTYTVETNDAGFRCRHEFEPRRKPGFRRVLLFGDSFTAGDGVSNIDRYGDVLERLEPGLEIFNFGLPGSGSDQHYLVWRELAGSLDHDAVVISVQVENIRRVASAWRTGVRPDGCEMIYAKPYFTLEDGELALHHQPVPREPLERSALPDAKIDTGGRFELARRAANALGMREFAQRVTRLQPLPEYDDPDRPEWRLMSAILLRWISEIDRPVLLVVLPLYHYVEGLADPEPYQRRFRELAEKAGCALHDPLADARKHPPRVRRAFRFPKDIHPTPAFHQVLAESIAPALRAILSKSKPEGI